MKADADGLDFRHQRLGLPLTLPNLRIPDDPLGLSTTIVSLFLAHRPTLYIAEWTVIVVGAVRLLVGLSDLRAK